MLKQRNHKFKIKKNMDIRIVIVTYIPYGMELSIVAIAKTQRIIRIMEVGG